MARIDIKGVMIPNDYAGYYRYFDIDCTCPADVQSVIDTLMDGEDLEVYINSPGGVIDVGSEIYTLIRKAGERCNVKIYIVGEACSAASVAAMAGYCEMSPTALMMVHCVSSGVNGNHVDMEHMAEVLRTADRALCTAYVEKSGMSESEALSMMEHETWLTAEQALEKNLIDAVMFQKKEQEKFTLAAGPVFALPGKDKMEKFRKYKESEDNSVNKKALQQKLDYLKLKGEVR
ncbi:MAG: Clp protease ClpP [Schaedlerella sp.]|nr:Clp protease ClpP [Lachnospiraceae bacterium]MDY4201561.1 Clp protease ClpP [Schaedlerella sp.]